MIRTFLAIFAVLFTAVPGTVLAAPQILGLVATSEAIPMQCAGGSCSALLSAFCLQEKRLPPDFETAYHPAATGSVTLVATMADGSARRLDASGLVSFRSHYGFTAVRAEITIARLGAMAPVALALEVAPLTTILPQARPGDPDPLTADEIALAAGPLRKAAQAVLEVGSPQAQTVQITVRLINALPRDGDIAASVRPGLWDRIAGTDAPPLARRTFNSCIRAVDQSVGYPLRKCLEERHERFQIENTHRFWESLGGS